MNPQVRAGAYENSRNHRDYSLSRQRSALHKGEAGVGFRPTDCNRKEQWRNNLLEAGVGIDPSPFSVRPMAGIGHLSRLRFALRTKALALRFVNRIRRFAIQIKLNFS